MTAHGKQNCSDALPYSQYLGLTLANFRGVFSGVEFAQGARNFYPVCEAMVGAVASFCQYAHTQQAVATTRPGPAIAGPFACSIIAYRE
jgi:hypothetical protein